MVPYKIYLTYTSFSTKICHPRANGDPCIGFPITREWQIFFIHNHFIHISHPCLPAGRHSQRFVIPMKMGIHCIGFPLSREWQSFCHPRERMSQAKSRGGDPVSDSRLLGNDRIFVIPMKMGIHCIGFPLSREW